MIAAIAVSQNRKIASLLAGVGQLSQLSKLWWVVFRW